MKGISQENQKAVEEQILVPLLRDTLRGFVKASRDQDTRRLFSVPLVLLEEEPGIDLPAEVTDQASIVERSPLFKPRGHYTDSEKLQKYFRAMQYLAKATIDVSIKPMSFPFPREMLYPFDVAQAVQDLFSDPANRDLFEKWLSIHSFYTELNGPPDLPTFKDLFDQFSKDKLDRKQIEAWCASRGAPAINPEAGIGIQPLGERVNLHEKVIDDFKRGLFKEAATREQMAEALRFRNLLQGLTHDGKTIQGIAEQISGAKGRDYYATTLRAVAAGAKDWEKNPMRLNFFAAALTSLAEQTALMARTSVMVSKSQASPSKIPAGLKLYFEPNSEAYLLGLAEASRSIIRICERVTAKRGSSKGGEVTLRDPTEAFRAFAALARKGKPLVTDSSLWRAHGKYVTELARKPAVTVDVFQVRDRSGEFSFYQWAVAAFEALYALGSSNPKAKGMEMVFFEAWSDELVPGSQGPLTNLQWESRIHENNFRKLRSIVPLPNGREGK
jgi:hypothetical protein